MKLPNLLDFDLKNKKVLVRVDYDVPLREVNGKFEVEDDTRIQKSLETIKYLLEQNAKVILLAHAGRPEGPYDLQFSLSPIAWKLQELLPNHKIKFQKDFAEIDKEVEITLLENLRFYPEEEKNDQAFAGKLASLGDFYVNEAFAVSHREHASVFALPKMMSKAAGFNLEKEVEILSRVLEDPKRPLIFVLGGAKEDKLEYVNKFLKIADKILIGGRLPSLANFEWITGAEKLVIGKLKENGKDINIETQHLFCKEIEDAGTVVWNGPMGMYEEEENVEGTKAILRALAETAAFTIVGGGDTESAMSKLDHEEKINFISSGGGAMLEFLANGDLPGLEALRV